MATGRFAIAICPRCGDKVPYQLLVRDGYMRGIFVCPKCHDEKEPKEPRVREKTALKHPQPDVGADNAVPTTLKTRLGVSCFGGET